mgnify:CR=1 FL=1
MHMAKSPGRSPRPKRVKVTLHEAELEPSVGTRGIFPHSFQVHVSGTPMEPPLHVLPMSSQRLRRSGGATHETVLEEAHLQHKQGIIDALKARGYPYVGDGESERHLLLHEQRTPLVVRRKPRSSPMDREERFTVHERTASGPQVEDLMIQPYGQGEATHQVFLTSGDLQSAPGGIKWAKEHLVEVLKRTSEFEYWVLPGGASNQILLRRIQRSRKPSP